MPFCLSHPFPPPLHSLCQPSLAAAIPHFISSDLLTSQIRRRYVVCAACWHQRSTTPQRTVRMPPRVSNRPLCTKHVATLPRCHVATCRSPSLKDRDSNIQLLNIFFPSHPPLRTHHRALTHGPAPHFLSISNLILLFANSYVHTLTAPSPFTVHHTYFTCPLPSSVYACHPKRLAHILLINIS